MRLEFCKVCDAFPGHLRFLEAQDVDVLAIEPLRNRTEMRRDVTRGRRPRRHVPRKDAKRGSVNAQLMRHGKILSMLHHHHHQHQHRHHRHHQRRVCCFLDMKLLHVACVLPRNGLSTERANFPQTSLKRLSMPQHHQQQHQHQHHRVM